MAYQVNGSTPSINFCLSSHGQYRGELFAPSFDLSNSVRVPLDSVGIISLKKVYMTPPSILSDRMSVKISVNLADGSKVEYNVSSEGSVLYNALSGWVDTVSDITKHEEAWYAYVSYILNALVPTVNNMQTKYQFQMTVSGKTTNGYEFDAVDANGDLTPKSENNREVVNLLATFSYGRGFIRLVNKDFIGYNSASIDPEVVSVEISGTMLKLMNMSPTKIYTFLANGDGYPMQLNSANHDYFYLRCSQR